MKINNGLTVGATASVTVIDTQTNQVTFSSEEMSNRVYGNISNLMLNGFPSNPQFLLGESNIDTDDSMIGLDKPFPTSSTVSDGLFTLTRISDSELNLSQKLYFQVTPNLQAGENRFIREMGLKDFDRFILQSSRGKKFAIEISDNSVINVDMTLNYYFKVDNPNVTLNLLRNGAVHNQATGQIRLHYNETSSFNWRSFLSNEQDSFLRMDGLNNADTDVSVTTVTNGQSVKPTSASTALTLTPNQVLTEYTYVLAKGQQIQQIKAAIGFGNLYMSLTPSTPITIPAEIVYIKTQSTLRR